MALAAFLSATTFAATSAHAAGTIAGTDILNTAQASYDGPGGPVVIDSNTVTITVDELLDVTVASSDPGDIAVDSGANQQITTYQVTNTGNGSEAFTLTADPAKGGDDFDTSNAVIYIDTNSNGVFDAGVDTLYSPGSNDPVLAPDASVTIFIQSDIPATATDGQRAEVELSAVAITGSGTPGTSFAGQGDGGGDAVVGSTGADGEASSFFLIQAAQVALVKSATIVDQFGGNEAVPGATITYQIVATITGSGSLTNLNVNDDIPTDTTYTAESITLEGAGVTDSDADADAGSFDGSAIAVSLGTVPGGQTRTITFQVTID
ncbi:DUF11 domain-containing protein [Parasphingorhabdus cellanae]|uniref:DUF11 domain-containing protein n=2 Tax=Parasphingorhabdus cellanae TaxID=2806553 RepID=A0ABX7T7P5_9SPHN|nr:DUF11 domain-containing protein [Parasphingorhabdus cellanae]